MEVTTPDAQQEIRSADPGSTSLVSNVPDEYDTRWERECPRGRVSTLA